MDESGMIQVTHQDLYDQVWSMLVARACRLYGLSDVGLAKICAEWEIPRPPRGYWAKKRNGKRVARKKLKAIEEGNPVIFSSKPGPPQEAEAERPPTESEKQRAFEKRPENRSVVPDQLTEPHPLVARTEKSIRSARPDESGISRPRASRCLAVAISPAQIDRALRILDIVVKALEARGLAVSAVGRGQRGALGPSTHSRRTPGPHRTERERVAWPCPDLHPRSTHNAWSNYPTTERTRDTMPVRIAAGRRGQAWTRSRRSGSSRWVLADTAPDCASPDWCVWCKV